jgi:SAM-dependent methyltransferase
MSRSSVFDPAETAHQMTTYAPAIFDVNSLDEAKAIILTPEGWTTDERWERETPWLVDVASRELGLTPNTILLDFGCGIGRLSRELIARTGCWVIGVDISPSMRALATSYVDSPRFTACAPEMLPFMPACHAALAIWVLQHTLAPVSDIATLAGKMWPGGKLLVLNNGGRAVPVSRDGSPNFERWADDGISIADELARKFEPLQGGQLPTELAPPTLVGATWWRVYRQRASG